MYVKKLNILFVKNKEFKGTVNRKIHYLNLYETSKTGVDTWELLSLMCFFTDKKQAKSRQGFFLFHRMKICN